MQYESYAHVKDTHRFVCPYCKQVLAFQSQGVWSHMRKHHKAGVIDTNMLQRFKFLGRTKHGRTN